jgi:hypothetical protein
VAGWVGAQVRNGRGQEADSSEEIMVAAAGADGIAELARRAACQCGLTGDGRTRRGGAGQGLRVASGGFRGRRGFRAGLAKGAGKGP